MLQVDFFDNNNENIVWIDRLKARCFDCKHLGEKFATHNQLFFYSLSNFFDITIEPHVFYSKVNCSHSKNSRFL